MTQPPLPLLVLAAALAAPADDLPAPRPERCVELVGDPGEDGIVAASGLAYEDVRPALAAVIRHALGCGQPDGFTEVHLTFELVVGCDGVISKIEASDDDDAPAPYVACVSAVIAKADFPAHDMPDGMPVTYPVDVSWTPPP